MFPMDESFHQTQKLSKEKMRELIKRSDNPALFRFVVMYILFLGTAAWVVFSWERTWWEIILSQLSFGIICCSTFAALHETAHNTAFKTTSLNTIAAIFAGIAHMYASVMFRELHFTHHRFTHIPGKDPEISFAGKPTPSIVRNLPFYFSWLTGFPLLLFKIGMLFSGAIGMPEPLRKKLYPFVRPDVRAKLMIESLMILAIYSGVILLAIYVHAGFWGILTGQVVGHCILASYLTPEHNGLTHEGNIFEKTRSMKTNSAVKLLMWNMPYHAEHHAYPAVPFHLLLSVHSELKEEIINKDLGYPEFHLKVLGRKFK